MIKCISCQQEVDPKFRHAIATNICPFCGETIIPIELQAIFNDLRGVMERANQYMGEVENWLGSNYGLRKINSNEVVVDKDAAVNFPVSQHHAPPRPGKGVMVSRRDEEMAEAAPNTTVFAQRAGVDFRKMVDRIKSGNAGVVSPNDFTETEQEEMVVEDKTPLSSQEQQEMISILDNGSTSQELELQKLRRLRSQEMGGGFRRRE